MVVAELTLTLVLLTGAGLMIRSFLKLYSMDLGVETAHILKMRTNLSAGRYPTPEKRQQFYDALLARLGNVPGVSAVATATRLPLEGGDGRQIEFEGRPAPDPKTTLRGAFVFVSPGYFDALSIPLRRGRLLRDQDGMPGSETVVVSERFVARFFPGEEALGKRFRNLTDPGRKDANPWLTIVGVVPSVRQANPQNADPDPVAYQPFRQRSPGEHGHPRAGGRNADVDHVDGASGDPGSRPGSADVRPEDARRRACDAAVAVPLSSDRCSRYSR